MIRIAVLGSSPERRSALIEKLSEFQRLSVAQLALLPELSIKPVAPEELKFMSAPEICIIDEEFAAHDLMELARIKKLLPETAFIVQVDQKLNNLLIVEQLARLGMSDTLSPNVTPDEFFRKVILLGNRAGKRKIGTLIAVDSGKGGSGATTLTAALAELLIEQGRRVVVFDGDIETQDLSRFLQARPFVNENLESILSLSRPIVEETVQQCCTALTENQELSCVSPCDILYDARELGSPILRALLSFIEVLDRSCEVVIVDSAPLPRAVRQLLYRTADHIILTATTDPASMHATLSRLQQINGASPQGEVTIAEVELTTLGLPSKMFRQELRDAAKISTLKWTESAIPYCRSALRWPGSGHGPITQGKDPFRKAVLSLATQLSLIEERKTSRVVGWISNLFSRTEKVTFNPVVEKVDIVVNEEPRLIPLIIPALLEAPETLVSEALVDLDLISLPVEETGDVEDLVIGRAQVI